MLRPPLAEDRLRTWALLMRWAVDLDVLRCQRCAGWMQLIATIDDPAVVQNLPCRTLMVRWRAPTL